MSENFYDIVSSTAWFLFVFGMSGIVAYMWLFKSGDEKKLAKLKKQHSDLQSKGFLAQRNGDMRAAGRFYEQASLIEDQIVELTTNATVGTDEPG